MAIKITLFITLVLYAAVISQSLFYALAMTGATKKMPAPVYIETRQLLTSELQTSLGTLYYFTLAASVALTTFSVVNPGGLLFITSVVALMALVADIVLAVKGNVPLNKAIDQWTTASYPSNWQQYRSKWFTLYHTRQVINTIGFVTLVAGMIFGI